jgi:chromosome partitioning protein
MKIITLLNEKGGVGKTTMATHIAAGLALRGHRVVLIDTDMQANATDALGFEKEPNAYDLFLRNADWRKVTKGVDAAVYAPEGMLDGMTGSLYVVTSNWESRNLGDIPRIGDFYVTVKRFEQAFDYMVIDTSPQATMVHTAIYAATDMLLFPTQLERWSMLGLFEAIKRLDEANKIRVANDLTEIGVVGVIPTLARMNTILHQENLQVLRDETPYTVFEPFAFLSIWAECANAGLSIYTQGMNTRPAQKMDIILNAIEHQQVSYE